MIWDNFSIFRTNYISARIHAHVNGSRVDVVTLPDENGEFGEILLQIFHSDGME